MRKGSGILDARWETANIIWSCGYDACLRRWDLRTGKCEQYWEDPFYSPLYCLDYDDFCTALTGCQSHGRVVLWDTRQKNYVQVIETSSLILVNLFLHYLLDVLYGVVQKWKKFPSV